MLDTSTLTASALGLRSPCSICARTWLLPLPTTSAPGLGFFRCPPQLHRDDPAIPTSLYNILGLQTGWLYDPPKLKLNGTMAWEWHWNPDGMNGPGSSLP